MVLRSFTCCRSLISTSVFPLLLRLTTRPAALGEQRTGLTIYGTGLILQTFEAKLIHSEPSGFDTIDHGAGRKKTVVHYESAA